MMVWKPHATVAAVIPRGDTFLVVEEPRSAGIVFNQPAGHLEDGESLQQAIIREVREETAWQFTPEYILGIYRWRNPAKGNTHMRTTFVGSVTNHDPNQDLFDGIISATWKTQADLKTLGATGRLRSPLVLTCINDYLQGQRYPLSVCRDICTETV